MTEVQRMIAEECEHLKSVLILTTNVNGKVFVERYGERVLDRLKESGKLVNTGDKSMRGAA